MTPDSLQIMLVEDNQDDFEATIRSLKKNNCHNSVKWCRSGQDAMEYLQKAGKYANDSTAKRPNLILLDLNMPGLDGRQILSRIKSDAELKSIPVVVLTTSADTRDVDHCYSMGASTYIQKPVSFEGLIEAFRRMKDYWCGIAILPSSGQE